MSRWIRCMFHLIDLKIAFKIILEHLFDEKLCIKFNGFYNKWNRNSFARW